MDNEKILNEDELKHVIGGLGESLSTSTPDQLSAPSESIAGRAVAELGKPYSWGAVGPDSYDSSGFVSYCITGAHMRIGVPSTFMSWPRVSNPSPGDICVSATHCGIYMGPGVMIHAPTFGQCVSYGPIQSDMIIVRHG